MDGLGPAQTETRRNFISPCRSLCLSPNHLLHPFHEYLPSTASAPVINHRGFSKVNANAVSKAPTSWVQLAEKPPDSDPRRIRHELEHKGYVEMPGRTRGENRAQRNESRENVHRHGFGVHAGDSRDFRRSRQKPRRFEGCTGLTKCTCVCPNQT